MPKNATNNALLAYVRKCHPRYNPRIRRRVAAIMNSKHEDCTEVAIEYLLTFSDVLARDAERRELSRIAATPMVVNHLAELIAAGVERCGWKEDKICTCEHPFTGADPRCPSCPLAGQVLAVARARVAFNIFADSYCARAMRFLAVVGETTQSDLMDYFHHAIGARGGFAFAFERFSMKVSSKSDLGLRGSLISRRSRTAQDPFSVTARGRNMVSWVGLAPRRWIALLTNEELTRAHELIERQTMTSAVRWDDAITAAWFAMVNEEFAARRAAQEGKRAA